MVESRIADIRAELVARMSQIEEEIEKCKGRRNEIEREIQGLDSKLTALRTIYEMETERLGEFNLTPKAVKPSRFSGMKATKALSIIRTENPGINKKQAQKILEEGGFDFRDKKPRRVVHFAWVALDRRKP
jgi:predicted nuclease with TOPRIM domain